MTCEPGNAQQENLDVISGWMKYTDAENTLYHHITAEADKLLDQRTDTVRSILTREQWMGRQEKVRTILAEVIGPFPEKTPLKAKIIRRLEKDHYRVEHIVYESMPGFHVTSSLFIPNGLTGTAPAIVYCSGHTQDGYRGPVYQHAILNLVSKGFIVFAFDPVGQGERLEYLNPDTGGSILGGATREHSYAGAQAFIAGSSQARYMIFDGIRAIDYLLTRKEVDPARIGITGRSGGGTQSAYIAAMDDRIAASAPECYITRFSRLLQSIGPQDAEQNIYSAIARGLDHADLLEVRAPRPCLMITTTNDFFSIQGARETAREVSRVYGIFGKEDQFRMVEDVDSHASTKNNREAMYAFFQKFLNNPGNPADEPVKMLTPEEIRVTPTGQVATSFDEQTVFSLNKSEAEQISRPSVNNREQMTNHISGVIEAARELSGYRVPNEPAEPVFTGRILRNGYAIEKYFIQGGGDYVLPFLLFLPGRQPSGAVIYLHPDGKAAEARPGGEIGWLVKQGKIVLAPDLPGTGELGPGTLTGDSYFSGINDSSTNTSYNVWFGSILIGRSIVGIQTGDLVRLVRMLTERYGIDQVSGYSRGTMSPVLLHAAALDTAISGVALSGAYVSWRSIVMNRYYNPLFISSTVAGALPHYDLPDLEASIAPRKLLILDPVDETGRPAGPESFNLVRSAYQVMNAGEKLKITVTGNSQERENAFLSWLK